MEHVRAVERALEILESFSEKKGELGLTEISKALMLPKATVFRLVRTMESKGYLTQHAERQTYRLGPRVAVLGNAFLNNLDYRLLALPLMKELRDKIQESVSIYTTVEEQRMCVQRVDSEHTLRQCINIGDRLPLQRGSAGKLLIAFQELQVQIDGVETAQLQNIRDKGYAISIEEREHGLASISAPIRDHKGEVIAALTISGPVFRFTKGNLDEYIQETIRTAKEISWQLGYLG